MKVLLEHLRASTIPHDMLEELHASNVKFYDGVYIKFGAIRACG